MRAGRSRIASDEPNIALEDPMRMLLPCLLAALLPGAVLAAGAPHPAADAPIAVVASVKGKVEVLSARGGAPVPAAFGRALERGDKVTVAKGGVATLFFGDGNVITLAEQSSLTIGGRSGATPGTTALPGEVFTNVSRFVTAGSRQSGLVSMADMRGETDASTPLLLAPRNTSVLDESPVLRWRAVPGATRYRVYVGPSAGGDSWTREATASAGAEDSLAFPADVAGLKAGVEYVWEVEAVDAKGPLRREGARVSVLTPEARESVRENLARIDESAGGAHDPAARFLAGSYLSGMGLYEDAARQFQALVKLAPESPEPHEALGNLYLHVGLSDWAAAEFQHALALQRKAH
jgi:hypothetical protein